MEDDNSWVFDSLICFLNGPVWNAPLQSFIEEKSLIFEPVPKDDDEYRKVHDEFKNLVDLMLGSYMEDIGITPEQFEVACNNGMQQKLPARFQENLFEQIWAANDFEMFKRMMTQKNIELQLQALELIEQKYGITPQLFMPASEKYDLEEKKVEEEEDKKSPPVSVTPPPLPAPPPPTAVTTEDVSSSTSVAPSEDKVLEEAIKQSEIEEETRTDAAAEELKKDPAYIKEEKKMLETALHSTTAATTIVSDAPAVVDLLTRPIHTQVGDAEIRKRQEYLKSQRDKLVALKKQVRKKHLEFEISHNEETNKLRPQSARAAEAVLATGHVDAAKAQQTETLKIRKALVDRLRSEVVGQPASTN